MCGFPPVFQITVINTIALLRCLQNFLWATTHCKTIGTIIFLLSFNIPQRHRRILLTASNFVCNFQITVQKHNCSASLLLFCCSQHQIFLKMEIPAYVVWRKRNALARPPPLHLPPLQWRARGKGFDGEAASSVEGSMEAPTFYFVVPHGIKS